MNLEMTEEREPRKPRSRKEIRRRMKQFKREREIEMVQRLQTPMTTQPFTGGTSEPGHHAGAGESGNLIEGMLPERARRWLNKHFPKK